MEFDTMLMSSSYNTRIMELKWLGKVYLDNPFEFEL